MKNKGWLCLFFALLVEGSELYAQNQVASPMEDVNLVIDATVDSLNKVRTVRPESGSTRKGENPVYLLHFSFHHDII